MWLRAILDASDRCIALGNIGGNQQIICDGYDRKQDEQEGKDGEQLAQP